MFPNSPNLGRLPKQAEDFLGKLPLALGPAILAQHQQQILELQNANLSRAFLSGNLGSISSVPPQGWPFGNGTPLSSPTSSSTFQGIKRRSDEQPANYDPKRQRIQSPQQSPILLHQLVPLREDRRYSVPTSMKPPLIQTSPRTPDVKGRLPPLQDAQVTRLETTLPVAKDKLSLQILELFQACQQQASDLKKKDICRAELQREIQQIFPQSRLYLVGSSLNGFGTRDSDADLCLVMPDELVNQETEARRILGMILKYFYNRLAYIEKPQLIRAKVPIVKFKDKVSGVEFDLNVNNVVGIRNTFLLRTYAHIENRVRPLVLVVKKWASHFGINDASRGTLSSYTLVLMVVHYLQTLPEPILPSLQRKYPECFAPTMQLNLVPQAPSHIPPFFSKNGTSLGELFVGFLKYFSTEFDFSKQMISVREAKAAPRPDRIEWRNKFICVEEPFDGTNTARAVHEKLKFDLIQEVFLKSYHRIQEKKDLNGILPLRATINGQKNK